VRSSVLSPARLRIPPTAYAIVLIALVSLGAVWGTIALSGTKIGIALALAAVFGPAACYAAITAPFVFPFGLFTMVVPFDNLVAFHSFGTLTKIIGAACAASLLFWIVRERRIVAPDRSLLAWLAFVVLGLSSFAWATDPVTGVPDIETLGSLFALFAIVSFMPVSVATLRAVAASIVAGGVFAGMYGAYLFHHGANVSVDQRLTISVGTQSIDPNHFAAALLLPAALTIGGFIEARSLKTRSLFLVCGCFIAAGMLLAASRGAIVAAVVMYVYLLVRSRRRIALGAIGVGAMALALGTLNTVIQRFSQVRATGGAGRLGIWRVGFAAFMMHPWFGSGLGNFAAAYNDAFLTVPAFATMKVVEGAHWSVAPHNNIVWVGVELGIAGVITYLVAWWLEFRSLRGVPEESDLYPMRVVVEAALVGLFVAGLFLGTVTYKYVWLAFMLTAMTRNAEICARRNQR
jgi:hypothetical protein